MPVFRVPVGPSTVDHLTGEGEGEGEVFPSLVAPLAVFFEVNIAPSHHDVFADYGEALPVLHRRSASASASGSGSKLESLALG